MATGKATIRGRNGTSTSGKKVSTYSPQYKQTTGKEADSRGTQSYTQAVDNGIAKTTRKAAVLPFNPYVQQDRVITIKEQAAAKKSAAIRAASSSSVTTSPLLDKSGREIKQIQLSKGSSHAVGIMGRSSAASSASLQQAYRYRQQTGRQISRSTEYKEKVASVARSFISSASVAEVDKYIDYANRPITSSTNAFDKRRITISRNIIGRSLPAGQQQAYFDSMRAFDSEVRQYKAETGYSDSKIIGIMLGKIKDVGKDKGVTQYTVELTKAQKAQRQKEYEARLKQQEIDKNLKEFAGDSKVKGAIAYLYDSTKDVDSIFKANSAIDRKAAKTTSQIPSSAEISSEFTELTKTINELHNSDNKLVSAATAGSAAKLNILSKALKTKPVQILTDTTGYMYDYAREKPVKTAETVAAYIALNYVTAGLFGYAGGAVSGIGRSAIATSSRGLSAKGLQWTAQAVAKKANYLEPALKYGMYGYIGYSGKKLYDMEPGDVVTSHGIRRSTKGVLPFELYKKTDTLDKQNIRGSRVRFIADMAAITAVLKTPSLRKGVSGAYGKGTALINDPVKKLTGNKASLARLQVKLDEDVIGNVHYGVRVGKKTIVKSTAGTYKISGEAAIPKSKLHGKYEIVPQDAENSKKAFAKTLETYTSGTEKELYTKSSQMVDDAYKSGDFINTIKSIDNLAQPKKIVDNKAWQITKETAHETRAKLLGSVSQEGQLITKDGQKIGRNVAQGESDAEYQANVGDYLYRWEAKAQKAGLKKGVDYNTDLGTIPKFKEDLAAIKKGFKTLTTPELKAQAKLKALAQKKVNLVHDIDGFRLSIAKETNAANIKEYQRMITKSKQMLVKVDKELGIAKIDYRAKLTQKKPAGLLKAPGKAKRPVTEQATAKQSKVAKANEWYKQKRWDNTFGRKLDRVI
ncbi:MAG: hypothetical protein M0R51_15660, partial [Clostridia bacterium]|nr:hypothetical protein [Clostridia bacterium]